MSKYVVTFALLLGAHLLPQVQQPVVVRGDEVERQWREQQELGELYKRAAASRFVVVGTVMKDIAVAERGKHPSMDGDVAGILHLVKIEEILCRRQDFIGSIAESSLKTPDTVHLFVPLQPLVEHGQVNKERLTAGDRYLLFLVEPDQQQQRLWTSLFELDAQTIYYRGQELARGVVPLVKPTDANPNPQQPLVLQKITQLCQAMHPSNRDEKVTALNRLVSSQDPILRKEARNALRALENSQK